MSEDSSGAEPSDEPDAFLYVGVGIGAYQHYPHLPRAVADATEVGQELAKRGFVARTVGEVSEGHAIERLRECFPAEQGPGGLVVLWSGHGEPATGGDLRLVATDSEPGGPTTLNASGLAERAAKTGATQILLLLDTCHSANGSVPAAERVVAVWSETPPTAQPWLGVLASAEGHEKARDGAFGAALLGLLRDGPSGGDPQLQAPWSPHNTHVRGDDLIEALLAEWNQPSQRPSRLELGGRAAPLIPNPRHVPDAPARVVEHLRLAARGIGPGEEGVYFSGRAEPLGEIVAWIQARQPGVFLLTGPPGGGKSAIVGRIVSLSNPLERKEILTEGASLGHADPGEGSIAAHVHARGLTAEQLVNELDAQLVRSGVIPESPGGPRARGALLDAIAAAPEPPRIVLDGLDEAGASQAFAIAEDVVRLLAPKAQFLIATRELSVRRSGAAQ